jgi:ATP synthase subunit 6
MVVIQVYNFSLNTVLTTFSSSDLKKSLKYFPFFLSIFFFILLLNTIGIIPYSSTVTSYLSVTLILTLIIIIGAYFAVFSLHGINFFSLFMPQGCPFVLIFFIIPIEFLSYVFRLISLSARLFANMMAGHSLLAVLAGFSWVMFNSNSSLIILVGTIPLFVVFLLFLLETGVAVVQAVVFTILSCMYMDQAVNLTH